MWWGVLLAAVRSESAPGGACGVVDGGPGGIGAERTMAGVYETLYRAALDCDPDGGGLLAFNYLSWGTH